MASVMVTPTEYDSHLPFASQAMNSWVPPPESVSLSPRAIGKIVYVGMPLQRCTNPLGIFSCLPAANRPGAGRTSDS
ncbi:hypothetical protein STRIP9103_04002 [Streptomyces ipomoeae 91-03]|uniref:Uncharacterized protein n=1 Tax=Streptomyces ipomoeae 91-03 TaxID=698759 RepID=L1KL40_9ACTN|nr:hypothetical protein STRIP9103_04002 [Streptomyces ipomoeae 91-03]